MKIEQRIFQGMVPKVAPHLLPENKAVLAENTKLYSGNLLPFKAPLKDYDAHFTTKSIYQYRDDSGNYWFEWPGDVDVVESPVAGDANNRVYYSGAPGGLRWTDNGLALSSAPYPAADRTLVFAPPLDAPILVAGTEPADIEEFTAETRSYAYTYVTDDGWESSPSPFSTIDDIYPEQDVLITIVSNPGTVDLNITKTRIYRTTPAGTWQFVVELPIGQTNYTDNVPTANLGELLVTINWTPAENDLIGLIGLDQGALCAFKQNELWFSVPYIPYAWPLAYQLSTMTDIVAVKAGAQSIYIATRRNPYVAFGTNPGEFQLVKIDEDLPCVSKRSMVDAGERAFYASTDGIVMFEGQTAKLVTGEIIHADQWQADFNPENINAVWFENKVFCFTPTNSFIFDPLASDIVTLDIIISDTYNSLEENTLYILVGTEILKWDSTEGSFMSYHYHSKDSIFSPSIFSSAQVNAESYDNLTFDLYRDKILIHSHSVVDNVPFRLPTKLGRKYSWGIRGTDEVRGVFLASTMAELSGI